jgi:signal transduction histidine kinase
VRCIGRPERVRVEVVDQGPGIPPEERARVWERFYRGRGVAGAVGSRSTGLGLAVVKTLVEAHGGSVGLACPPEGGSIFWFEVPTG